MDDDYDQEIAMIDLKRFIALITLTTFKFFDCGELRIDTENLQTEITIDLTNHIFKSFP